MLQCLTRSFDSWSIEIEDYDLFDYDREVQPILNVLLTKSVEQALLEVEEETELQEIRKFKSDY